MPPFDDGGNRLPSQRFPQENLVRNNKMKAGRRPTNRSADRYRKVNRGQLRKSIRRDVHPGGQR